MTDMPVNSPNPPARPALGRPSLLLDLENRQEEVLWQLDELNRRIELAVNQGRLHAQPPDRDRYSSNVER
jgi:hypothetical protein